MINILMAGNRKYSEGGLISVLSILKHTQRPINVKFFTMDLTEINDLFKPASEEFATYMDNLVKEKNPESKFEVVDVTNIYHETINDSANKNAICTPYTLLRLLADKVGMPDKYIYLDVDTIINRDLRLLYDIDIEDYELGVVRDAYRLNRRYFNAGVMLVNHKKCIESGLYEKTRDLIMNKKMLYADQDALNRVCTKRKMLPLIYNSKDKYYPEIVVHHFCNVRKKGNWFYRIKPWEVDLVKTKMSAYNDILDDYLRRKQNNEY